MSHLEALALARTARLAEANRMSAIAVAIPKQSGRLERAGSFEAAAAMWEACYGNGAAARQKAAAALALSRGREVDSDLAMGNIGFSVYFGKLYPIHVRGLAYLAAQQPVEAAAEFQRIVDHRSIVLVDPIDAFARLQLARARRSRATP